MTQDMFILRGLNANGSEVFYTGKAGDGWISEHRGASFGYVSQHIASEKAKLFNSRVSLTGVWFIVQPFAPNPMLTGTHERERRESGIIDEVEQFNAMVRSICPIGGKPDEYGIRLGNVEFWIDADGPWANRLSFSIPTSQWDTKQVSADLAKALQMTAEERKIQFEGKATNAA